MHGHAGLPSLPALRRARGDLACPCPPGWEEKYAFITCGWRNRHICTIQSVLFKTQRALTATQRVYPRETLSDGEIDGKTKKCFSFFFLFGVVFPHAHSLCVPCLPGDLAARQSLCHPGKEIKASVAFTLSALMKKRVRARNKNSHNLQNGNDVNGTRDCICAQKNTDSH